MNILIIGAGWEQYALIQRIKELGHHIIATHPKPDAESFPLADETYVKESRDIEGHLKIAENGSIDAVVTDNCDYSLYTASVIAAKLDLPFASIRSAVLSNDKFEQREQVSLNEIKQPGYYKVRDLYELKEAASNLGYPVILKPLDNRGTFGITVIRKEEELKDAFIDAVSNSYSHQLICEQFIDGTLVTVDGFCFKNGHQSLTVASSISEKGSKPVTKKTIYPANFSVELNNRLMNNHHKVVESLGYDYGHTHGEYMVTEDEQIYFVECTNRGGGVYISSLIVPLLTGIDVNKMLVQQSLGKKLDIPFTEKQGIDYMKRSVVLAFHDFKVGGTIKSINLEEMRSLEYTERFRTIFKENDIVESVENCAARHTVIVVKGENAGEAEENFERFKSNLDVQYT